MNIYINISEITADSVPNKANPKIHMNTLLFGTCFCRHLSNLH